MHQIPKIFAKQVTRTTPVAHIRSIYNRVALPGHVEIREYLPALCLSPLWGWPGRTFRPTRNSEEATNLSLRDIEGRAVIFLRVRFSGFKMLMIRTT
jgi:hypothetical protein